MRKKISLFILAVLAVCCMCFFAVACGDDSEHDLVKVNAKEATCEADGNVEYYRCKDSTCGKLFKDSAGKTVITEAETVIQKLGHEGGTATCSQKAVCTRCGNEYGDTLEHEWKAEWITTAAGHSHECKNCDATTDVYPHKTVVINDNGKDATCTESGINAGEKCSVCLYVISEPGEIPALGHTMEHRTVRAATCTEDGYKADHYYCTACEKYFDDENGENELNVTDVIAIKTGHAYGDWTTNGDGTHTRICGNDNTHTETGDCSGGTATCQAKAECENCHSEYGALGAHNNDGELEYDDESGHYTTCGVCGNRTTETAIAHTLGYESDDNNHWKECACGYATAQAAHAPASIVASLKDDVAATLYEGQVLTAADVTVVATCECGHTYNLTEGYTVEDTALIKGNNELEVTLDGTNVKTTVNADASDAPAHTLTLIGATFASSATTASVKANGKLPGVVTTAGKTFYGFKDAEQNYYTADTFVMPDSDLTITALYKEDMLHYAPSDHHNNWKPSTNTAEHKEFGGVMGTEITFKPDSANPVFFANSASDSKTANVNVYAPVYGKTLMILTVINDNDEQYEITYGAENNGAYGQVLELTLAPRSTTVVPINYWLTGISFAGCDHQITMVSEISEEVKLGFYGYIAVDGDMAINTLNVSGIDTFYSEGDTFDLSNVKVQASVSKGKHNVNIYDYTVSVADGSAWNSSITEITVTACGYTQTVKLNDLSDWMAFTFSHDAGATGSMSKAAVTVDGVDGSKLEATKVTVGAGATAGNNLIFHTHTDNTATKTQNYNVRVPVYGSRSIMYVVTNTGSSDLTLWLGNDTGTEGTEVLVRAGAVNQLVTLTMTGNTSGGWMKIGLAADAPEGGEVVVYGYFKTNDGEFTSISVRNESQHKTSYQVGETLDTSNLIIKPTPSNASQANDGNYTLNLTNYKTEIVGHESDTFTADDAGQTFTVKVYWNGFETSYQITVAA